MKKFIALGAVAQATEVTKNNIAQLAQTGIFRDANDQVVDPSKDAGLLHVPLKRLELEDGYSFVKLQAMRCLASGQD